MAQLRTLFCVLLFACVYLANAQTPTPDLSAVPPACLTSGTSLQTECAATFAEAQTFFKVAPGQIPPPGAVTPAQIQVFLAQAKPPSPGCCKVACQFNNDFCSCEKAVVDFAAQLAGNAEIFQTIGKAFATACKFTPFVAETCPAPAMRATTVKPACPA